MRQLASFAVGIFTIILALWVIALLPPTNWESLKAFAALLSAVAASLGLFFVGMQINSSRRLARAQFVNELARDIDEHAAIESKLDREGPWYPDGCELNHEAMDQTEKYLNFFERVKHIRDTKAVDMRTIDGLFAYRFFHLTHNPNVQTCVLYHPDMSQYFEAIFDLHADWLRYRQSRNLPIPRPETPLRKPGPAR